MLESCYHSLSDDGSLLHAYDVAPQTPQPAHSMRASVEFGEGPWLVTPNQLVHHRVPRRQRREGDTHWTL